MNQNQQIDILNSEVKATIGVSKIAGVGVIALTDIFKGQKVYANQTPKVLSIPYSGLSKLFPYVRKIVLDRWPSIINGSRIVIHDIRLMSLMNHGKGDRSNYDPNTDTALKDILVNSEILEDYTKMENWSKIWPPQKNPWIND